MLEIEHLDQFYGGSHTLWDLSLRVEQGDCLCVMGRNGVGKTTLLRSIMGTVATQSGVIRFGGADLRKLPVHARAKLGIGYVPQGREIFPQLTVEENLHLGLVATRDEAIPERIFELFPVLKTMKHRRGGDLSGGQQQQLAIGRALVLRPSLLVLDEPTEGIQPNIVQEIGNILVRLNREDGISIILVEQKLAFAKAVASRFAIMDRGRVVFEGGIGSLADDVVKKHLVV